MSHLGIRDPRPPVVFLPADEFAVERVFPIRNFLVANAVEGTQESGDDASRPGAAAQPGTSVSGSAAQSLIRGGTTADIEESKRKDSTDATYLPPPYPPIPHPDTIRRLPSTAPEADPAGSNVGDRPISERSQYVPSKSGPPGVLPGAAGEQGKSTFYRCEDEPIRIPGAIQHFGALVALKSNSDADLECRICSENSRKILGYGPEELFRLKSFLDILETDARGELAARIAHAQSNPINPSQDTQLDVFNIAVKSPDGAQTRLWCAIHALEQSGLVICEFEDYSDMFYLKDQAAMHLPPTPTTAIGVTGSPEEKDKSTTSGSTPLKALQMARWRQQTRFSSMDIFNAMTQAQQQLAASKSVQQILDVVVGIISELTTFHRVMFYRFDELMNGSIDAELVDANASHDLFRGKLPLTLRTFYPNLD
jgi:hypothetical protein